MMEAGAALSLQSCPWSGFDKAGRRAGGGLRIRRGLPEERRIQSLSLQRSPVRGASARARARDRDVELRISCGYKKSGASNHWDCWTNHTARSTVVMVQSTCPMKSTMDLCLVASAVESENSHASVDEALILKWKSEEIVPYLHGRCIFLVGMMGSGKTTVGKILSEVLGYSFFDSDKLVEQAVGMSSVAQIFKERSEAFFRDSESDALRDLSSMHRLVVATGGGAVIRPINWRYMQKGITVWLDVPLEALARRIAAVGTASRPLLHQEPGDPYTKAYTRLTTLSKERGEAYANADARVCLEHIAAKQGHDDVSSLSPTAIAIEALIKIECFLTEKESVRRFSYHQW